MTFLLLRNTYHFKGLFPFQVRYDIARANRIKKPIIFLKLALSKNSFATISQLLLLLTKTILRSTLQRTYR